MGEEGAGGAEVQVSREGTGRGVAVTHDIGRDYCQKSPDFRREGGGGGGCQGKGMDELRGAEREAANGSGDSSMEGAAVIHVIHQGTRQEKE